MDNTAVSAMFDEFADWLEIDDENPFRVRAYRRAAQVVRDLPEDVAQVAAEGRLTHLEGIGKDLAGKIVEFLQTGKVAALEELRSKYPPTLRDLLQVPDVGPKTVALLYKRLNVSSLDELEEAAQAGKLAALPRMGKKTQENILRGIQLLKQSAGRVPLEVAWHIAESIVAELKPLPSVEQIIPAGSLRRWRETIGDIDILATTTGASAEVMDRFVHLPGVTEVLAHGETKSSVIVVVDARRKYSVQVDLRVVPPGSFGAALQYFTGSKDHNITLRARALKQGLTINEYGVFEEKTGKQVAGATEEEVYAALGLPLIPPELRENRGEVEAAAEGRLPDLIDLAAMRGDLHAHTTYSDGHNTIAEMADAARARGYEYLAITDHSKPLAWGMDEKTLRKQIKEIRQLNEKYHGFRILTGCEVDILSDGRLGMDAAVLQQLDIVIASVHSNFKQSREEMTRRIIRAMETGLVDIIAHPTGRLVGQREGYDVDVPALIEAAKRCGVALEINAHPDRLDLNDLNARAAKNAGVLLTINTDAHAPSNLDLLRFGVHTARRAWVEKKDVLNTMPLDGLLKWRQQRRGL
ncbi:MAG: DNA polymerase/3'-5' exonuclease PolX [Abditibacteriales bacterium]|nr:DNA polymerase/3'-5' exonuclease PolX [Abditibacteriales bacterium]MDW8365544.1 DNA polymerase/3'-5' exonuclease PolX [Abditibacteriales bacterium]